MVLLLTKPSLWFIVFTSFRFILTTFLAGLVAVRVLPLVPAVAISAQTVALVTVVICLGRLVWALLVWTSHVYMLTNQRVVTIKGVVNVNMFQANLQKIQRTTPDVSAVVAAAFFDGDDRVCDGGDDGFCFDVADDWAAAGDA